MSTVFHVVLWTEGQVGIEFSLGLEGTIATREVAERCAEVYRECLQLGYETLPGADPTQAFRSRVGILEIPAPDPRLGHPPPRDDVEQVSIEIRHLFERKYKKGTST